PWVLRGGRILLVRPATNKTSSIHPGSCDLRRTIGLGRHRVREVMQRGPPLAIAIRRADRIEWTEWGRPEHTPGSFRFAVDRNRTCISARSASFRSCE